LALKVSEELMDKPDGAGFDRHGLAG